MSESLNQGEKKKMQLIAKTVRKLKKINETACIKKA